MFARIIAKVETALEVAYYVACIPAIIIAYCLITGGVPSA